MSDYVNDGGPAKEIAELRRELAELKSVLADPAAVWTNMLRGQIAMPQAFEVLERERNELRTRLDTALNLLRDLSQEHSLCPYCLLFLSHASNCRLGKVLSNETIKS